MGKVVIILVLYNNCKYLKMCIDSLLSQTYKDIEIIAIDNASPDGSVVYLKQYYPNVKIIEMDENRGFAEGCNRGIRYFIQSGAQYCMLLNVDTVADLKMVSELVEASKGKAVTTPYIYYTEDKVYAEYGTKQCATWYAGGKIDRKTAQVDQKCFENEQENANYIVDFVSGCCMMIPRKSVLEVGELATEYFMYYEDVDYCIRLLKEDIPLLYVSKAVLWHAETGSQEGKKAQLHDYYCARNRLYIMKKFPEQFQVKLIDQVRNTLIELKCIKIEGEDESVNAQIQGINDFLRGKVGVKNGK